MLKVCNSLGKKLEKFESFSGKVVRLYTCGPTVYARPHIGNLRTYSVEDTMKRYLLYKGFRVRHVMNITDFDRTIMKEVRKTGMKRERLTIRFEKLFKEDMSSLGCIPAEKYPHVSQYIDKMADRVKALLKKGLAYKDNRGKVFLDVSKFPSYGRLVGKRLSGSKGKVAWEEYRPGRAGDFLLWNPCSKGGQGCGECFQSKIGPCHPAWNLQCAVMSTETLGKRIDLAMGGRDNLFNHHENTRAVVSTETRQEYAKYWMHIRHLILNGRKMSKSKGNAILLPDLMRKGFSPRVVRMLLVSAHYKKRLDFSWELAGGIKARFRKMEIMVGKIRKMDGAGAKGIGGILSGARKNFESAMDDDLNIPKALAVAEEFIGKCARLPLSKNESGKVLALLKKFDSVLACLPL